MKKFLKTLLVAMVCLSLVACGTNGKLPEDPEDGDVTGISYPENSITVIVPFNAGSNTDSQFRFFQPYLEKALGQKLVIVNNGGASGTIGTTGFLEEKADGYTVLFTLPTPTVFKPVTGETPYKTEDLLATSRLSTAAMYLAVKADSSHETGEDVIKYIKENPEEFSYANAGAGGIAHLAFASFLFGEDLKAVSVPFTGGTADCYTAVMGGHVDSYIVGEQDLVGRDDVKPLINLGTKSETEGFENVPTLEELGYSGYVTDNFSGFYFSKNIDSTIANEFDKAVEKAVNDPDFIEAAEKSDFAVNYGNSDVLTKQIKTIIDAITPVMKDLGLVK